MALGEESNQEDKKNIKFCFGVKKSGAEILADKLLFFPFISPFPSPCGVRMLPKLSAEHIPIAPTLLACWGLRHEMAVWNSEVKIEVYSARGKLGMDGSWFSLDWMSVQWVGWMLSVIYHDPCLVNWLFVSCFQWMEICANCQFSFMMEGRTERETEINYEIEWNFCSSVGICVAVYYLYKSRRYYLAKRIWTFKVKLIYVPFFSF